MPLMFWRKPAEKTKEYKPLFKRYYSAGKVNRLTSGWTTAAKSPDDIIRENLPALRARSREQYANNDYMRRFANLLRSNVVGPKGIRFQSKPLDKYGKVDTNDAASIERAFIEWGRKGNCEVTKSMSWVDVQRLFITTLVVDGEVLAREINQGPHNYQLQMLDIERLDINHNRDDLPNGSKIRFSIEFDGNGAPVAYYLAAENGSYQYKTSKYKRIPAEEIIHCFLPERVGQKRGVPLAATAMLRMNMLGGYEEAAVTAARIGASTMGFFTSTADGQGYQGEDTEAETGAIITEMEPGTFEQLPHGVDFKSFDPDYPHQQYDAFVKSCLRGISAGLGISYHSLANDLEGVNYTSSRTGALEDREEWKAMQEWMIDNFNYRVVMGWLSQALMVGVVTGPTGQALPFNGFGKFKNHVWRPRRWAWVDPLKDTNANVIAINNGLRSRGEIIRESGGDPDEVWAELEAENARLSAILPKAAAPLKDEKETDDA